MKMRPTLTTLKSFIRKNANIQIQQKSRFDGMIDGTRQCDGGFVPATRVTDGHDNELGIKGAWFVFGSRDHFTPYETDKLIGYEVYNCCGSFILAADKTTGVWK
jgi:hypothetical protein